MPAGGLSAGGVRSPPAPRVGLASGWGPSDLSRSLKGSSQGSPLDSNLLPRPRAVCADGWRPLRRQVWREASAAAAAADGGEPACGASRLHRRRRSCR
eukprot:5778573-Prymnesium_polylepis.1